MILTGDLTTEQSAIVDADLSGPFVVDAGAGTGKTYTLVQRAVALVERKHLAPSQILIVTFMKKAAIEVGDRLTVAFQHLGIADVPQCTTFHALAASLVREFAYECGASPDFRAIDDFRARAVFAKAYDDLVQGRLDVVLDDFPLLERSDVLQRSLATAALDLKNRGVGFDSFERDALTAAETFKTLPFGQLWNAGKYASKPRVATEPKVERTPEQRRAEGECESRNVRVVAALFRRFDDLLQREALLTYGDLLTRATAMLADHPAIVRRLRERWLHAMVDEFQDTNPQQLAFLRAIFGDALVPVMAIGDVRQAIFEWNGADPEGIQLLAQTVGTKTFPLSRNRRSPQQILDAAHHVLPRDASYAGKPLIAHKGNATEVVIRVGCFGDASTTLENRASEAAAIAHEVRSLIDGGTPARKIAILLRARTHARVYARALARMGVASKTHGGVGFYDAPEIRDGVAWLRLMQDPTDAFALVRVLESPVIGLSAGTVARLFDPPVDAATTVFVRPLPDWLSPAESDRLQRLRDIVHRLDASLTAPAPEAVRAMVRETGVDLAQEAREAGSAPQIRANVAKLVALATSFVEDRPLATLVDFLSELDERDALEIDESEAELSGEEVAIMTIHSAKGLEWDYVFLANVAPMVFPNKTGRSDAIVDTNMSSGALGMRYDCDGAMPFRWLLRKPHDPLTGEHVLKAESDEERRLCYVALTRAKRMLWISGAHKGNSKSDFMVLLEAFCDGRSDAETFGAGGETLVAPCLPAIEGTLHDTDRVIQRLSRLPALLEVPRQKLSYTAISTYATCPRLARYRYVLRVPDLRANAEPTSSSQNEESSSLRKLDASTYGNIVHLALESIARGMIEGEPVVVADAIEAAIGEYDDLGDATLLERVTLAVERSLDALASYVPVEAEGEFELEIAGCLVGGFVDLIARDRDGNVHVIDYKTGHLPDSAYALQLALYARALATKYPNAATAILRINDDVVELASPELPTPAELEARVAEAASLNDDTPSPGIHCRSCAYAGVMCPEGHVGVPRC